MLISCCINTYKRPILLRKLLTELEKQNLIEDWKLEVILVDNDPETLGKSIHEEFVQSTKFKIYYYEQHIKNISLTRNLAVKKANGELILFIDDDGHPETDWIINMVHCMNKYDADGVFGTVLPNYEEGVPKWIKKGKYFDRIIQKTGEISQYKRTGNCLIKTKWLSISEGPFDPNYGLTGGEDTNLFEKIQAKGAKLVFCKEGVVYDYIPVDRANLKWLLLRSYRSGRGFTINRLQLSQYKIIIGLYLILRSILFLSISFFLFVLFLPSKIFRTRWLIKIMSNLGHLSAFTNIEYKEYN